MRDIKMPLEAERERLLNKFENDFYSLTVAAYLKAQNRKLSKKDQDDFVMSLLNDAKKRYYETVVDLSDDLIL